ncbi:MAG: MerR family transcriptional regulator [Chloroflexota bacterium]
MTSYSLADLCDLADVTPRTVRYYIAQGLLRPPTGAGPAARYDDGHLYRLRLIRRLQRDHLPLGEIRNRLSALTDPEVERLTSEPAPALDSASDYIARLLGTKGTLPSQPGFPSAPAPLAAPARMPEPSPSTTAPPAGPPAPPGAPIPEPPALSVAVTAPSLPPEEPVRSQWERIVLTPDIELHVRRPLGRIQNRRVDRLLETARHILKEADE